MTRRSCRALTAILIAAAASGAGACGGDDDQPGKGEDAFSQVQRKARERPDPDRAAPRWEPLAIMRGPGAASKPIQVASGAVDWHARWRCTRGSLVLTVDPPPSGGNPLRRVRCPDRGVVEATETGRLTVSVRGNGPWRVSVSQQVTRRLDEPPLPAMSAAGARELAQGSFYAIERDGEGSAQLIRLPGGRLALRLEGFRTSANSDLFVWLSKASRPRTTRQALRAPHRQFAALKSTVGNQNYLLPRSADVNSIHSIVIWCEPVRIAYTAAALAR